MICEGEDYEDDNLIVYCSVRVIILTSDLEMQSTSTSDVLWIRGGTRE